MTSHENTPQAAEKLLDLIKTRRSVRKLDPGRPVPSSWVTMILEAAIWAPSGGNRQPWAFKAITDREMIGRLGEASSGQGMFDDAPLCIAVIALPERSAQRYQDRGRNLYCLQDTAAAVQNMLLLIHSLGLGATWVGAFDDDGVSSVLGLAPQERPVALLPTGFPRVDPRPTPRRPLEEVVEYVD